MKKTINECFYVDTGICSSVLFIPSFFLITALHKVWIFLYKSNKNTADLDHPPFPPRAPLDFLQTAAIFRLVCDACFCLSCSHRGQKGPSVAGSEPHLGDFLGNGDVNFLLIT